MQSDPETTLADVLAPFVGRSAYSAGQLAQLSGLPKATIVNWLAGRVRKPRERDDLLRLAEVLHLAPTERNRLLSAAGHAPLPLPLESAPRPPFQAIADLPYFVGREAELAELERRLLNGSPVTISSLQGMGGVGKTSLAAHLAYRLRPHFPDGVLWARLDRSETMAVLSTFARAYGADVSGYADLDSRSRVVRELLADKRVLIVLDNAESSEQVVPLLPPTGPSTVLLTTRRQDLDVTLGGLRVQVGPFDAQRAEALALFERLLGAPRVAAERAALGALAEALGHLPLAVAIAASRLAHEPGWSAARFLAHLHDARGRMHSLAYGAQSVQATFALSFAALSPPLRALFAALGRVPGSSVTVPLAAALMGWADSESEEGLRTLYRLSLVQHEGGSRYRLHPLLHDFARAQPADDATLTRRVVDFYVTWVGAQGDNYAALDEEADNLLAALALDSAHYAVPQPFALLHALVPYLDMRGHLEQAVRATEQARRLAEAAGDPVAVLALLKSLGYLLGNRRDHQRAIPLLQQGLALAETQQDDAAIVWFLGMLAHLSRIQGRFAQARGYVEEALALAEELALEAQVASLTMVLGELHMEEEGPGTQAGQHFLQRSLAIYRRLGSSPMVAVTLYNLATLAIWQENFDEADARLQEMRPLLAEDTPLMTHVLGALSEVALHRDDVVGAEQLQHEALALAQRSHYRWSEASAWQGLGQIQRHQQRLDEAAVAFEQALALARELGLQSMEADALFELAQVAQARGDSGQAQALAQQSLALFQPLGTFRVRYVAAWLAEIAERESRGAD